jgi:hypothetical protein
MDRSGIEYPSIITGQDKDRMELKTGLIDLKVFLSDLLAVPQW